MTNKAECMKCQKTAIRQLVHAPRLLEFSRLEDRLLLTVLSFIPSQPQGLAYQQPIDVAKAVDIDGDGDQDLMVSTASTISYHENLDGLGTFGSVVVAEKGGDFWLDEDGGNVPRGEFWLNDINGDGHVDLLLPTDEGEYDHFEELGRFGQSLVVSVFAKPEMADLDNDGDLDRIQACFGCGFFAWQENTGGEFSELRELESERLHISLDTHPADLDGDGDVDIIGASTTLLGGGTHPGLGWFENLGGLNFAAHVPIAMGDYRAAITADMDGDGDLDIRAEGNSVQRTVKWFENVDGNGSFAEANLLPGEVVTDIDHDNDLDIVSSSGNAWWENIDGNGNYAEMQSLLASSVDGDAVGLVDIDGDGFLDVLVRNLDNLQWYENRMTGDADDNGKVEFADFLALSANFGAVDAVWEDGDFDGNGKIEFADFLALSTNFGSQRSRI